MDNDAWTAGPAGQGAGQPTAWLAGWIAGRLARQLPVRRRPVIERVAHKEQERTAAEVDLTCELRGP